MKRILSISALFIGTVIGAGFATGREIALFFDGMSPLITALAGLILGALCSLFLALGNLQKKATLRFPTAATAAYDAAVFLSSLSVLAAMTAGAEQSINEIFGIPFLGLICLLAAIIVTALGIEKIKTFNLLIMPVIIVFIAVLFVKNGVSTFLGQVSLFKPLSYGAFNIFLSASMLTKIKLEKKEIILCGLVTGTFFAFVLFMLQNIVRMHPDASMPVLTAATNLNLQFLAVFIILAAIITTLISSLHVLTSLTAKYLSAQTKFKFLQPSAPQQKLETAIPPSPASTPTSPTASTNTTTLPTNHTQLEASSAKIDAADIPQKQKIRKRYKSFFVVSHTQLETAIIASFWAVVALALSAIGFSELVNFTYPAISLFGTVFTLFAILQIVKANRHGINVKTHKHRKTKTHKHRNAPSPKQKQKRPQSNTP